MKFNKILAVLSAIVLLHGCVRVDVGEHAPSLGRQLIDLYEARELGAITEAEFEDLRRRLVRAL